MGRKPDTVDQQAAKGNPGRRKTKVAKRAELVERVTEMLAPLSVGGAVPAPPVLLGVGFEIALAVWNRLAPELSRTHRLPKDTHDAFAIYCCTYGEWLEMELDIAERGRTQRIKNVSGSSREVDRPSVRHRQTAYQNLRDMWPKFGLTPMDQYSLFKDQRMAAQNNPGLFGDLPQANAPEKVADAAPVDTVIGSAARHRSAPPAQLN